MVTANSAPTPGIQICTEAVTKALKLTLATTTGLALDGEQILTLDLLKTGRYQLNAFEALLQSLGYRLDLIGQDPVPQLRGLPHDHAAHTLLVGSLPREIPLTPVSNDEVVKRFRALAMVRRHAYGDATVMSLQQLAERVAAIAVATPRRFRVKAVTKALDVVPLLLSAHNGLVPYQLPLLCGYGGAILTRYAKGGAEPAIDRHVTLYAHLGLVLRVSGPAGEICIRPTIKPLSRCLKAVDGFRQLQEKRFKDSPAPKPQRSTTRTALIKRTGKNSPRKTQANGSKLTVEEICKLLSAGVPPRQIAESAQVSHQRIYLVAKRAGLSVRQRKAKIASEAFLLMPVPPSP